MKKYISLKWNYVKKERSQSKVEMEYEVGIRLYLYCKQFRFVFFFQLNNFFVANWIRFKNSLVARKNVLKIHVIINIFSSVLSMFCDFKSMWNHYIHHIMAERRYRSISLFVTKQLRLKNISGDFFCDILTYINTCGNQKDGIQYWVYNL